MSISDDYRRNGYVVLKSLFSDDEISSWRSGIEQLSGISKDDFDSEKPPKWARPSGPSTDGRFFSAILNNNLLNNLKQIFGKDLKYLHHNDLHAGFGAHGYHRDSVYRGTKGQDFEESEEPYLVCRVAVYLQTFEESGFKFGIVPRSHRKTSLMTRIETSAPFSKLKKLLGLPELIFTKQDWITTEPGDAIIFDTRCWHRGGLVTGPKYSFFIGYGVQNSHFNRHWKYYSEARPDLDYSPPSEELVEQLRGEGLWPEHEIDDGGGFSGAFLPNQ